MLSTRASGTVLAAVACAALLALPATASDWPRFRGPNGTGVSADSGIPVEFGEKQNLRWKVEIPGAGNSSPIVSKQKIFLQAASADGAERTLICLDLATGKIVWKKPAPGVTARTHAKNTLASCTAAADGERVYMPFWDGVKLSIAAFDYDGGHLWTRDLGLFTSQHGAGHSPLVVGQNVILANDQDGVSEVVALDAASGEVLWKTPRTPFKSCYSTPILLERPGAGPELIVTSTGGVSGYDPTTGSEKWNWNWESNNLHLRTVGSPVVSQGLVFFSGGNGPGDRHAVAVSLGESGPPALAWETRKVFPYVPCMLTRGDYLYFVNDSGVAACHVAKTGENVWTKRLEGGNVTASPLMADGKIYSFTEAGNVHVLAAEPTFKLLGSSQLDEGVMASPAVADGCLIVRGKQHLYCFRKAAAK